MKKSIATAAAGLALGAALIAAPAQAAYHGSPRHPVAVPGRDSLVTLDEWQAVQVGWSRFHVQNVFDNDGVLNGDWTDGPNSYKEKTYPGPDTSHLVRIVYITTSSSPEWAVDLKEWCTQLPTGDLSCLSGS